MFAFANMTSKNQKTKLMKPTFFASNTLKVTHFALRRTIRLTEKQTTTKIQLDVDEQPKEEDKDEKEKEKDGEEMRRQIGCNRFPACKMSVINIKMARAFDRCCERKPTRLFYVFFEHKNAGVSLFPFP